MGQKKISAQPLRPAIIAPETVGSFVLVCVGPIVSFAPLPTAIENSLHELRWKDMATQGEHLQQKLLQSLKSEGGALG